MTDVTLAGADVSSYGLCCKDGRDRQAEWLKGLGWAGLGWAGLDWWRDINKSKYSEVCVYQTFNGPGVVGAVLQTPL